MHLIAERDSVHRQRYITCKDTEFAHIHSSRIGRHSYLSAQRQHMRAFSSNKNLSARDDIDTANSVSSIRWGELPWDFKRC